MMQTTEIPTDLLLQAALHFDGLTIAAEEQGVLHPRGFVKDVRKSVEVNLSAEELECMLPLIKWLEYINVVWAVED
jgi:hypothetical protein